MILFKHILLFFCVAALPAHAVYQYVQVNQGGYFEMNAPGSFDITFVKTTGDGLNNVGYYTIADDGSPSAIQQATQTGKDSWSFGNFDAGTRVGIWLSSRSGYEFTSSDYYPAQNPPSMNYYNGDGTYTLQGWVNTGGGNNKNAFFTYGAPVVIVDPDWTCGAPLPGTLVSCVIGAGIVASARGTRQRRRQQQS